MPTNEQNVSFTGPKSGNNRQVNASDHLASKPTTVPFNVSYIVTRAEGDFKMDEHFLLVPLGIS